MNELDFIFGQRLREQRKALGLKKKQFAQLLGCSADAVRAYERGQCEMKALFLAEVAQLGVDVQYVITGCPAQVNVLDNLLEHNRQQHMMASLLGTSKTPIVFEGFINYNCTKYYAVELVALHGQTVEIVEQGDDVLQVWHNGAFVCFISPIGLG